MYLNLCMQVKRLVPGLVVFISSVSIAQNPSYPRGYFRNPLAIPMELTANFGEIRSDHWHMGLDLRTRQKENQPVYAAAAGYISHVGIRPHSFGRYIVINHPNGLSTLYAHLNEFFPALETYVRRRQHELEQWSVELDLDSRLFPVRKGQFIAYSGNTGGSQGPHLHFEIRETRSQKCLNPLLFGFPLADEVPPDLYKLAVYDADRSVYRQTPVLYSLKRTDSGYVLSGNAAITTGYRRLRFALQASDRLSGSPNPNGIYSAFLFGDSSLLSGFVLDSISYSESRFINAQIDYRQAFNSGADLQFLSPLPGDVGPVYHFLGPAELSDSIAGSFGIEVRDAARNLSRLRFSMQYSDSLRSLPNPVEKELLVPGAANHIRRAEFEALFSNNNVYDTVPVVYWQKEIFPDASVSRLHQLNDLSLPVHEKFTVKVRPARELPEEWKQRLILRRESEARKAEWENGWITASFNDFGSFQAFVDLAPPEIAAPAKAKWGDTLDLSPSTSIVFRPADNFGIKSFRAELNGQWAIFSNDKGRTWVHRFDSGFRYGLHHLRVRVEDLAGNITEKEWWFRKLPYSPPKKKAARKKSAKPRSKSRR